MNFCCLASVSFTTLQNSLLFCTALKIITAQQDGASNSIGSWLSSNGELSRPNFLQLASCEANFAKPLLYTYVNVVSSQCCCDIQFLTMPLQIPTICSTCFLSCI